MTATISDTRIDLEFARLALHAIVDLSSCHENAKDIARAALEQLAVEATVDTNKCRCRICGSVFDLPAVAVCPTCNSNELARAGGASC